MTAVDIGTLNEGIKFIAVDGRNIEVTFETDASNEDFSKERELETCSSKYLFLRG